MPAKTKKDLEEDNKKLRKLLKEATSKVKEVLESNPSPISEDLDEKGFSIIKRNGKYKIVDLAFNAETKSAAVLEVRDASRIPEALHMADMESKKLLQELLDKAIESER